MNFQPLFTAARVLTATYRIVSTVILLAYIGRRLKDNKLDGPRPRRRQF